MKERPIIFSPHSVQGILAGCKTQTRRVMQQPDSYSLGYMMGEKKQYAIQCGADYPDDDRDHRYPPHGVPGDRLWVKEPWVPVRWGSYEAYDRDHKVNEWEKPCIMYAADPVCGWHQPWDAYEKKWRNAMFMPRWASRLTLEITDLRVEKVQNISEVDAIAEGIIREDLPPDPDNFHPPGSYGYVTGKYPFPKGMIYVNAKDAYREVWDSINGKTHPWSKSPWVWVIEFKPVRTQ